MRDAGSRHLITLEIVEALLSRDSGHAVLRHGPTAELLERFNDTFFRGETATRFSNLTDLLTTTHGAVVTGDNTRTMSRLGGSVTRLVFDFELTEAGRAVLVDYATRTEGVIHFGEEFQGVVRTVVDLTPGEIPTIVTSYPRLG